MAMRDAGSFASHTGGWEISFERKDSSLVRRNSRIVVPQTASDDHNAPHYAAPIRTADEKTFSVGERDCFVLAGTY